MKSKNLTAPATAVAVVTLVDESEAAKLIGYTVEELRSRRYAGKPPVWFKLGGRVRYAPADLAAWIEASRQVVQKIKDRSEWSIGEGKAKSMGYASMWQRLT